jgi:hypothetical protein
MPAAGITSLQTVIQGLAGGSAAGGIIGTKKAGPVGIESIIEYRGPYPLYLNVADWVDTFLVTSINGLDGADLRLSATPNPGEHGETPGDPLWGGRTLVLTGKQYAQTIWKLRDMQVGLRAALMDIKHEWPLIFHALDPADDLQLNCKLADKIQIVDQQTTRNSFERDFQITLRASNPRFVGAVRLVNEFTQAVASYNNIAMVLQNKGNFEAQTTIELTGPMTNPVVYNEDNGTVSAVTGTIPAGETWVLEQEGPAKRMYRKSDGANRFTYLAATSSWLLLAPNLVLNHLRFTASGLATGWNLKVVYRNTFM